MNMICMKDGSQQHPRLQPTIGRIESKVPQRAKGMQACGSTALHHLIVALHIRRDEDDLCAEPRPRILEQRHGVRAAAALLRVPQDHALGFDVVVY